MTPDVTDLLALSTWLPAAWVAAMPAWMQHTDLREWVLIALSPAFMAIVGIEWLRMRREVRHGLKVYDLKDSMASLNLGGAYMLLEVILVVWAILPAMGWLYERRLFTVDMNWASFAALFLGVEFCYYWFHRASHRIRWFWCAHVVHHGSEHMNFTTAMRQSWLYSFSGNWLFYLPMVWLGFDPRWVLAALSLNLGYQFFVHTQWVDRMPAWFEFIFNTPSHHRAHHGRNPEYIDRNYGGTFIVFDRLFGTFVKEEAPVDFGLVRQVKSHNVLWLTLHEWVHMLRDALRPGPLGQRLKHVWGPPEWERDGQPHPLSRAPAGRHKADNPAHASSSPH